MEWFGLAVLTFTSLKKTGFYDTFKILGVVNLYAEERSMYSIILSVFQSIVQVPTVMATKFIFAIILKNNKLWQKRIHDTKSTYMYDIDMLSSDTIESGC